MNARRPTWTIDASAFKPTPSQRRFLASRARRLLLRGGFGSGKTSINIEKTLDLSIANPGLPGIMVSATYQQLDRTMLVEFAKRVPKEIIRKHHETKRYFILVNGSTIYYGSADKPDSLDGPTLAWATCDEIRIWKAASWRTVVSRVRHKEAKLPQVAATSTPAMGWMHDVFGTDKPNQESIATSTLENKHNLDDGYVDDLIATFSPRQLRSLLHGEWTLAEGAVFDEWNPDRCLIDWTIQPHARTVLGIDFGVRKPAVILAQILSFDWATPGGVIPAGTIILADELHVDETPTVRLVDRIRDRWPGLTFDAIYVDPAGNARDQNSGMPSVYTLESAFGKVVRWSTEPDERWIPNGIALLQGAIAPSTGAPRVRVARALADPKTRSKRGVVAMLEGLRYPEKQTGSSPDHPVKDGELDHVGDAARYLVQGILRDEGRVPANVRLLRGYAGGNR